MENIARLHGRKFKATIEGTKVEGKISYSTESKELYLCQNERNGNPAPDKLGYFYSWTIGSSIDPQNLKKYSVINLQTLPPSWETLDVGGKLIRRETNDIFEVGFRSGNILILINSRDEATSPYTLSEIKDLYTLVPEEGVDGTMEFTLEEIAAKVGVPVDKLRIKD